MTTPTDPTAVQTYLAEVLPWAHGHQLKAITAFVTAILARGTGNQAALARGMGNQEAAVKRLSRLIHNERLCPRRLADAIMLYIVHQLPRSGRVRLALDWTIEADQYLLVISLLIKGRAVPLYWRAYPARVLKGRMKSFEVALMKRVLTCIRQQIGTARLIVTADRAFAAEELSAVFDEFAVKYVIRSNVTTKVQVDGEWVQLQQLAFTTNARHRSLGRVGYCESAPRPQWVSLSRIKNEQGQWEVWYLISNFWQRAQEMASEYARRFGCEQGFRDAKRLLGFAEARIAAIPAWARFFALFALALLILVVLATAILKNQPQLATTLLRRIASRRRGRWELSLVNAMLTLLQLDPSLYAWLHPALRIDLEAAIPNVS